MLYVLLKLLDIPEAYAPDASSTEVPSTEAPSTEAPSSKATGGAGGTKTFTNNT